MGCILSILVVAILLSTRFASAEYFVKRTSNYSQPASSGATATSFSATFGPYMAVYSYSWSQYITPTIVGTVQVTVNEATNQTWSTTVYNSEFENNGSMTLLTRTDTDAAGTVTQVVQDLYDVNVTVTYPTDYFEPTSEMTWGAVVPVTSTGTYFEAFETGTSLIFDPVLVSTLGANGTCCLPSYIVSTTPSHTPFQQTGSIDTQDPSGWLYTLVGVDISDPWAQLDPEEISSLWAPTTLGIQYSGCPYTACTPLTLTYPAAASAVASQANILATSTTTISSDSAPGATPAAESLSSQSLSTAISSSTKSSPDSAIASSAQSSTTLTSLAKMTSSSTAAFEQATISSSTAAYSTENSHTSVSHTESPINAVISTDPIVIGDVTIAPGPSPDYIVSQQTLQPGSSLTLGSGSSTTIVAMQTSNSYTVLVVGSSSTTISPQGVPPPAITIWSSVVTANSASEYIIDGQTLSPGTDIVVSGTTIIDIAGCIWLGLGGISEPTSTTATSTSTDSNPSSSGGAGETNNSSATDKPKSNSSPSQTSGAQLPKSILAERYLWDASVFAALVLVINSFVTP